MVMAAVVVTAARSTYSSIGAGTVCDDLTIWSWQVGDHSLRPHDGRLGPST